MAKIPDLREFGGEFLLCDKAGQARVLIRPQPEHQSSLAERLGGHGFEWSTPHAGFVADRHLKFSDLARIFPGVQLVDAAAVGKVKETPGQEAAMGASPLKLERRNVWIPKMTPGRLDRLLAKVDHTANDIEDLKDFRYFLLTDEQSAAEKGFTVPYLADGGSVQILRNKFWLTNIAAVISKAPTEAPQEAASETRRLPSAQAWIATQDDRIAARDIAFGDHEKLCLDIEHGRRQMTPECAKAMIKSAEVAGVLCEQRSAYMTGRVEAWISAVRSSELETPAWHTPIPHEGLAPHAVELRGNGYRWVSARLVSEALDAVTQLQWQGTGRFHAYVRPAEGGNHGRVRFLPTDQSAPGAPWFLLREEPFPLGFMPRENAIRQVADLLSNKPVIAVAPAPESAAPAPAM
jgi:hypothetical protein